jgi:hypothetical protein
LVLRDEENKNKSKKKKKSLQLSKDIKMYLEWKDKLTKWRKTRSIEKLRIPVFTPTGMLPWIINSWLIAPTSGSMNTQKSTRL